MHLQPPDRNNPSNPLYKVAALTFDKEYLQIDANSKVRVIATLNFKRSDDLRGQTKTKSGDDVTVCFTLALRRASFELLISFEDAETDNANVVNLRKVAHLSPLPAQDRITDKFSTDKKWANNRSLGVSAQAAVCVDGISAKGGAIAKFAADARTAAHRRRRVSRTIRKDNVRATVGGNAVHWEISPSGALDNSADSDLAAWLEGEVFQTAKGIPRDACVASWKRDEPKGPPVLTGSVFTSMQDLVFENIRFLTNLGEEVSPMSLDGAADTIVGKVVDSFKSPKERILKQIVRKHLVSQGMITEGARVQICKASA